MAQEKSSTADRELRISRTLNAPVELVWEVWTNPEHIKNWWGPNGFTNTILKMEVRVGGEWLLTMHGPDGTNYPNKHVFKEIIPLKKIVMQHFNPNFLTTVEFEDLGGKTQLNWCGLFESSEAMAVVVKAHKADEGMKQNVEKLGKYLSENVELLESSMFQTQYVKDMANKKITVRRRFKAPVEMVWKAWTDAEILDQWWAPKPWKAKTKEMNFTIGGSWLYAMVGPNNEMQWSKAEFISIQPLKNFYSKNYFCDENGNMNTEMRFGFWDVSFSALGNQTLVTTELTFQSEEHLLKMVEMGFQQGFAMAHGNLDELIGTFK